MQEKKPKFVCVVEGNPNSLQVANLLVALTLQTFPDLGSLRRFLDEDRQDARPVVLFDLDQVGTVRFTPHKRGKCDFPSDYRGLPRSYVVAICRSKPGKPLRAEHVVSLLKACFVDQFETRTASGDNPWGKKPTGKNPANLASRLQVSC